MDTYKHSVPYDSIDGSYPTAAGMKIIADLIIRKHQNIDSQYLNYQKLEKNDQLLHLSQSYCIIC